MTVGRNTPRAHQKACRKPRRGDENSRPIHARFGRFARRPRSARCRRFSGCPRSARRPRFSRSSPFAGPHRAHNSHHPHESHDSQNTQDPHDTHDTLGSREPNDPHHPPIQIVTRLGIVAEKRESLFPLIFSRPLQSKTGLQPAVLSATPRFRLPAIGHSSIRPLSVRPRQQAGHTDTENTPTGPRRHGRPMVVVYSERDMPYRMGRSDLNSQSRSPRPKAALTLRGDSWCPAAARTTDTELTKFIAGVPHKERICRRSSAITEGTALT